MRGVSVHANSSYGKPLSNVDPRDLGVDAEGQMTVSSGEIDHRRLVVSTSRGGPRTFSGRSSAECPPLLFIDNLFIGDALKVSIDEILALEAVQAIEVYSSVATVPPRFNRPGSACGVIIFWTQ